jgi:hypothetical protein
VSLDPPTVDQPRAVLDREKSISSAVDAVYGRLASALTADLFEEGLLETLRSAVEGVATHSEGTARLRDAVGDPAPADLLRAVRRETNDPFEQRLPAASDLAYRLVTSALREQFVQVFGSRSLATSAMDVLDASNRALAQRGLLPAFTL